MKTFWPGKRRAGGFTLVELLVVIAIIAILAVVGMVVFKSVTGNARDSRRKSDLDSLAKAYEVKYVSVGSYQNLSGNDFSSGGLPSPPEGGSYNNLRPTDNSAFRVCTALENNPSRTCSSSSVNCYCITSTQGSYIAGSNGLPPDSPSSCDPNGTLTTGIVGYWKLDEGNGTTIYDSSGNGISGSLVASPVWISSTVDPLRFKSALNFDGLTQNINISGSSLTNFIASAGYTISVWVRVSQYQPNGGISGCCGSRIAYDNSGDGGFDWRIWNNGVVSFYRPTTWCAAASSVTVPLNQWVHLVATYNNQQVYLYMNSNQIAQTNTCNFLDSTGILRFNNPGGNHGLFGDMDDLRIYNRALSAQEVSALYNSGNGCLL